MGEPEEEEGLGGDGRGGGVTWQQNTQIIKLSFEAYRHGKSRTYAALNLPYICGCTRRCSVVSSLDHFSKKKKKKVLLKAQCCKKAAELWGPSCLLTVSSAQICSVRAST